MKYYGKFYIKHCDTLYILMGKKRIAIDLEQDDFNQVHSLRKQVINDPKLAVYTMNSNTRQSWYRFIVCMGLVAIKEEFEKRRDDKN